MSEDLSGQWHCLNCRTKIGETHIEVSENYSSKTPWRYRFCNWWCLVVWLIKRKAMKIVPCN